LFQIDAWLSANKHIQIKGANDKYYTLSKACEDIIAYEKLTDEVID
jgi:hypothetical protein